jgi:hypothetical protein
VLTPVVWVLTNHFSSRHVIRLLYTGPFRGTSNRIVRLILPLHGDATTRFAALLVNSTTRAHSRHICSTTRVPPYRSSPIRLLLPSRCPAVLSDTSSQGRTNRYRRIASCLFLSFDYSRQFRPFPFDYSFRYQSTSRRIYPCLLVSIRQPNARQVHSTRLTNPHAPRLFCSDRFDYSCRVHFQSSPS